MTESGSQGLGVRERFDEMLEEIRNHANVKSVYGEPVEAEGKTIIPVAKIAYGFGAGFGSEEEEDNFEKGETEGEHEEAGGVGGGASAKPVGVLEITEEETRFVKFGNKKKLLGIALLGLVIGYIFGKK